ncbi:hypothetical protein DFJ74DRAFT_710007 [Hyaloraphidium curvatum]|nr:hypothetical protein DFJ74DRAFT_710007 [Hyaloraphidium curvatum]
MEPDKPEAFPKETPTVAFPTIAAPPFSAPEMLALFPAPLRPPPGLLSPAPPDDALADARAADPLTRSALLDALRPWPLLHAEVRAQQLLLPVAARFPLLSLAANACGLAMLAPQWVFADRLGRFSPAELGFGTAVTAAFAVWLLGVTVFLPLRVYRARFAPAADLSGHPWAVVARWSQLCASLPHSPLLRHDPADDLCPCAAEACAGKLPGRAAALRMTEGVARIVFTLLLINPFYWMPAVTYGLYSWTTPWSLALLVLYFLTNIVTPVIAIAASIPSNPAVLHLSLRLHRRAVLITMRDLAARYRSLLLDGPRAAPDDRRILVPEPYATLHTLLVPTWLNRLHTGVAGPHVALVAVLAVAVGVASIAFGNCVVGFTLFALLYAAVYTAIDMANYVVSNSQVGNILSLHSQAESLLRDLASRSASADPTGDSPSAVPRARARELARDHAGILAAHARGAGGFLAKFAGAVVDAGVARTALVTVFTIAAGLWSVLRGSGVRLTMNTTCG